MRLSQLLDGVQVTKLFQTMYGRMVVTHEISVGGVQYDSRKVGSKDLFVAMRGLNTDGHRYIEEAVHRGAIAVLLESDEVLPDSYFMHHGVVKIVVQDSRQALATVAANFYGRPAKHLQVVGVTGTNGKTTTTHLIKSVLEAGGARVGLVGTIANMIGNEIIPTSHTTPESLELQALFASMVQEGCAAVVMEVSSHALAMRRVHGIPFRAGVFTNLTQDHLDFHGSMEEYFRVKKSFFESLSASAIAVTNADDPYGNRMVEGMSAPTVRYGMSGASNVTAENIRLGFSGTSMSVRYGGSTWQITSSLIGRFNVQNILAAFATGVSLGIEPPVVAGAIEGTKAVRGRFEQIVSPGGWTAIVDYAHTPDAMENCLRAIHDIRPRGTGGRVITVFGCGGNRDRTKRPKMGMIATNMSDVTIITSDNPRHEDPQTILNDILAGVGNDATVHVEPDRHNAIRKALTMARTGDIVLLAGKGHETYQAVGEQKVHFDDREEVETFITANT